MSPGTTYILWDFDTIKIGVIQCKFLITDIVDHLSSELFEIDASLSIMLWYFAFLLCTEALKAPHKKVTTQDILRIVL